MRRRLALVAASLALIAASGAQPPSTGTPAPDRTNGFAITRQLVDREKIIPGGPPRDGIRSVDAPRFAAPEAAQWAQPDTTVLGVALGGEARAYPVAILEFHQIVNDAVGGVPIAVTYDPLAGVPLAFRRTVDGRVLHFGVSGLLYNSNFLLFDRETESLWSQFEGRAIAGELAGRKLERVPVVQEDYGSWLAREPKTQVLAPPAPEQIDYSASPFEAYAAEDDVHYPIEAKDRRFHAKEQVIGVVIGGKARAYLASLVTREGGKIHDEFRGRKLEIDYASDLGVFRWKAPADAEVTEAYWFAWKAFHPDTEIWHDPGKVEGRAP
jgi:hypothetical protein